MTRSRVRPGTALETMSDRAPRTPGPRSALRAALVAVVLSLACSAVAEAATFSCSIDATASPFCIYTGPIRFTYVNENNLLLIFFDTSITPAQVQAAASSVGLQAPEYVFFDSASISGSTNPDFAASTYAMALAAQLSGSEVTFQMRPPVVSARLRIDRIFLRAAQ